MNLSQTYESCLKAARQLGQEYPYYTPATLRVRFEQDDTCPTACIDSKLVIRYNDGFLKNMSFENLKYVILHEIMHYMGGHHKRFLDNCHKKDIPWMIHNIAMDMEINCHIGKDKLPIGGQFPETYGFPEGKSYEEYLLMLLNNKKSQKYVSSNMPGNGMPGQSNQDQQDPNQGNSKCGDLDISDYQESGDQDESTRKGLVAECEESESKAKLAGKDHSFSELMKKIEKIRYPWKKVFKSLISNRVAEKAHGYNYRTYAKPNKHLMGASPDIVHGSYCDLKEHIDLVIGIDISGSMGPLVEKMYGVMKSIIDIEELDVTTTILECDTEVSKVIHNFDFDQAENKVGHGGGTDMGAISRYVEDQKWNPDLIVIMTDNYTGWDPVLFKNKTIVLTNNETNECPYKQFLVSF